MSITSELAVEALWELKRMLEHKKHEAGIVITDEAIRRIEVLESMRAALKRDLLEAEQENERLEGIVERRGAAKNPWLSNEQIEDMREAALPLMRWLRENCHPHCKAIVDSEHIELMEGIATARREPLR
jgi:hypothetical protein